MKTTQMPDVSGILDSIAGIKSNTDNTEDLAPKPSHPDIITDDIPKETLWNRFKSTLNSEPKGIGRKSYMIDCDLIDTLDQCDFEGQSKINVINAILRTFLEANVDHLLSIKKRKLYPTILDNYEKTGCNT